MAGDIARAEALLAAGAAEPAAALARVLLGTPKLNREARQRLERLAATCDAASLSEPQVRALQAAGDAADWDRLAAAAREARAKRPASAIARRAAALAAARLGRRAELEEHLAWAAGLPEPDAVMAGLASEHAATLRVAELVAELNGAIGAADYPRIAEICGAILADRPGAGPIWRTLAQARQWMGDDAGALAAARQALAHGPDSPDIQLVIGTTAWRLGDLTTARTAYEQALRLDDRFAHAWRNLGNLLKETGDAAAASAALERAAAISPEDAEIWASWSGVLVDGYRYRQAAAAAREALRLDATLPEAWSNLGAALLPLAGGSETVAAFREALRLRPSLTAAHSNLLFALNFDPKATLEDIAAERRRWAELHAAFAGAEHRDWPRLSRDPTRRLRVGYVSADFRLHAMRYFLEPLLAAHDKSAVEIALYSVSPRQDSMTERYREIADIWRPVAHLSDAALAAAIAEDQIDVLVDLSGHTGGNRLPVFGRRPAPVSVANIVGSGTSTGLAAIDVIAADDVLAPPGSERAFGERALIRLPRAPFVFAPTGFPDPGPLPASQRLDRSILFASFSRAERFNDEVLQVWAKILHAVPSSRLLLSTALFADADGRAWVADRFARLGIGPDRLVLDVTQPQARVAERYGQEVDIALDPWPQNGGTTTLEALWMGVPVVTRTHRPSGGRYGAAILTAAGMTDWIAHDDDAYVALACRWAADLDALADLRAGLRSKLRASPLSDARGLARCYETIYRRLWEGFLAGRPVEETVPEIERELRGLGLDATA